MPSGTGHREATTCPKTGRGGAVLFIVKLEENFATLLCDMVPKPGFDFERNRFVQCRRAFHSFCARKSMSSVVIKSEIE